MSVLQGWGSVVSLAHFVSLREEAEQEGVRSIHFQVWPPQGQWAEEGDLVETAVA